MILQPRGWSPYQHSALQTRRLDLIHVCLSIGRIIATRQANAQQKCSKFAVNFNHCSLSLHQSTLSVSSLHRNGNGVLFEKCSTPAAVRLHTLLKRPARSKRSRLDFGVRMDFTLIRNPSSRRRPSSTTVRRVKPCEHVFQADALLCVLFLFKLSESHSDTKEQN